MKNTLKTVVIICIVLLAFVGFEIVSMESNNNPTNAVNTTPVLISTEQATTIAQNFTNTKNDGASIEGVTLIKDTAQPYYVVYFNSTNPVGSTPYLEVNIDATNGNILSVDG